MASAAKSVFGRIPASLGKLWQARDELSFAQIRASYLTYTFPLTILLVLHDLRSTYFSSTDPFLGSDVATLDYTAFAVGCLMVLLFFMKRIVGGLWSMTVILAAGFALWLLLPAGDVKTISMLIFHFGAGGGTIYAIYAHIFTLNNAERLLSMCIVAFVYGMLTFLYHDGIVGPLLSELFPALLILALVICVFSFKAKMIPDTSPKVAIAPPKGIYIVLVCPFAFFAIDVFGENLLDNCPGSDIALRGIGTVIAVLLAVMVQFGFRRSVWYMLNLFLIFTMVGILLLAMPANAFLQILGSLLFGIGDGVGYIMIFYIVGVMKKYRNGVFFLAHHVRHDRLDYFFGHGREYPAAHRSRAYAGRRCDLLGRLSGSFPVSFPDHPAEYLRRRLD